jgi:hypothetical protein
MRLPSPAMRLCIRDPRPHSQRHGRQSIFQSARWAFATEPSLDEFEAIAAKAFRQLSQKFRALCEDLVIRVEDFPTWAQAC